MTGPTTRKSKRQAARKAVARKPAKKKTTSNKTGRKAAKAPGKAVARRFSPKVAEPRKAAAPSSHPMSAAEEIDAIINGLGDWRGEVLARMRRLILQAEPGVVEEVKWRKPSNPNGVPVWSRGGIVCTGETYKDKVKLTFAKGAAVEDPVGLFNASLDGNARRAIDIHQGEEIDEKAFEALVRAAAALNAPRAGR